ncbi:TlyA family rRNA (cytidine-2'-O)-methyltransferase, partial [Candidatus Daviesbacteria bacterium]|nr:TlyA family rRNA (cytidine-2'-O)-methyltransferase [Candidatus Daviesbacteria bacterium]
KVYALDTAYGELAWKLRNDPRVVVMERTNILHLRSLPEQVDLVTIDAGWTKLELVLPKIKEFLKKDGRVIALLKPHYEAEKRDLIKGVLPEELLKSVKNSVKEKINNLGFKVTNETSSPILGGGGNSEFLLEIVS